MIRRCDVRGGSIYFPAVFLTASVLAAAGGLPASRAASPTPRTGVRTGAMALHASSSVPLAFEANHGQTDTRVRYLCRTGGCTLFLTDNAAVFRLVGQSAPAAGPDTGLRTPRDAADRSSRASAVSMSLAGGAFHPHLSAEEPLQEKVNYFLGNDPRYWQRDLPTFGKVHYAGVYPGIDLVYYGHRSPAPAAARYRGDLEYDFVVAPGADPEQIRLVVRGAGRVEVGPTGSLIVHSSAGELRLPQPFVYQKVGSVRRQVACHYMAERGQVTVRTTPGAPRNSPRPVIVAFRLGTYDRHRTLVIDPTVNYVTTYGGSRTDQVGGVATDPTGAAYVAGYTTSPDFPASDSLGTLPPSDQNAYRVVAYVMKRDAQGAIAYSTFLGGQQPGLAVNDLAFGIGADKDGNAVVTGRTTSFDFPVTPDAYQRYKGTPPGGEPSGDFGSDAFVTRLSGGGGLLYSTYLGGPGDDEGAGAAAAPNGDLLITGRQNRQLNTQPVSLATDAYVARFTADGGFVYQTFLNDPVPQAFSEGYAVAADAAGNAFAAGQYVGPDGSQHGLVAGLLASGGLAFSYQIGASHTVGTGVGAAGDGGCWVSCTTSDAGLAVTRDAYQRAYRGGNQYGGDVYVAHLDGTGQPKYATYLGGSGGDGAVLPNPAGALPPTFSNLLCVDPTTGDVWLAGVTQSDNFPTVKPLQKKRRGGFDGFITQLHSGKPVFSTFVGLGDQTIPVGLAVYGGDTFLAGQVFNPSPGPFPAPHEATTHAAVPRQGESSRGFVAAVQPWRVHWQQLINKKWVDVDKRFRIPISQPLAKTKRQVEFVAIVDPASAASSVILTPSSGVEFKAGKRSGARIEFTLEGTVISNDMSNKDNEYVEAHDAQYAHDEVLRGRVLAPWSIATPHDVNGGGLVTENFLINNTTTPTLVDPRVTAPKVGLVTELGRYLTITVNDQFGDRLGKEFDGAAVTENGSPLNVVLNNGQYQDAVFTFWPDDVHSPIPVEASKKTATAKAWSTAPPNVIPRLADAVQNTAVEIDGISLSDGIRNRQLHYTFGTTNGMPATVGMTIEWP